MTDEEILEAAKEKFELSVEAEEDNRTLAHEDIRFSRLGEQWDKHDEEKRGKEGRPCLTINRLPAFVRQVSNDARQNTPSIHVSPVDANADPETAKVLQGLLRNIQVQSNADSAYDQALDDAVTGGFGYFRIDVDYTQNDIFDQDIVIKRVANPFTVYGDPRSMEVDSSDWNCAFITEMMPKDQFENDFPDAEKADWESDFAGIENSDEWLSEDSVRVVDYWVREEVDREIVQLSDGSIIAEEEMDEELMNFMAVQGIQVINQRTTKTNKVKRYTMTAVEILDRIDWPGMYIPIVPVYGEECWVEGKRYFKSLIRDAKDPQRIYNYWRTASAELVALAPKAPFVGAVGQFDTAGSKWATANTESHPYLQYDPDEVASPPQRQPFAGPPAGALQEALNAADDMKSVIGIFDSALGAASNEVTGKAIIERKRQSNTSTYHFNDNLNRAVTHAGKIILDLIPHVYTEGRMIRVLGEDDKPENVPLNQPIPMMEQGQPVMDQQGMPMTRIHDLTKGKYDIIVRPGPSYATRREEAAAQMMELLRVFPQAAPYVGDIFAKNLDWPGADQIAERLERVISGAGGQDGEKEMLGAQLKAAMDYITKLEGDQNIDQVKVQLDAQKVGIDQFKAETDRMEAEAEIVKDLAQARSYGPVTNYPLG